jgi:hypothetical protein
MKNASRNLLAILLLSLIASLSNVTHGQTADSIRRIPVWRAKLIAQDLMRFDSVMSEHTKLSKDYADMKEIALTRLNMINMQEQIISDKNIQISLEQQKTIQAMKFQLVARKYKRQRNWILVGVGAVVVGTVVKVVQNTVAF